MKPKNIETPRRMLPQIPPKIQPIISVQPSTNPPQITHQPSIATVNPAPSLSCKGTDPTTCQCSEHILMRKSETNVVPGELTYCQAVRNMKKTAIVSDSMCRSIRVRDFNNQLDPDFDSVVINKYPAAHANQIHHYSDYTLDNEKPDTIIVMAGTNDVSYDSSNGKQADPENIACRIIDIGRNAKENGVSRVFINGLIKRKGTFHNNIINRVNLYLRNKCCGENFYFIDNSDIQISDLCDGLHLNDEGNTKFMRNLLMCCDSYNPYLLPDVDCFNE